MDTIWHLTHDGRPAEPGAEGFVHCSFTSQLDGTLALHFREARSVTLLQLDRARLGEHLRLEVSRGGARFPHVYRGLEEADVLERRTLLRGPDGRFDLTPLGRRASTTENTP
jgi:uncharacterized protein (DUF952 family)